MRLGARHAAESQRHRQRIAGLLRIAFQPLIDVQESGYETATRDADKLACNRRDRGLIQGGAYDTIREAIVRHGHP